MKDQNPQLVITVGGETRAIVSPPGRRLSEVLRDELGLKSVKVGCDAGDCGACTVLIDGKQHCACLVPVAQAAECTIETLETVDDTLVHCLQESFLDHGAAQCGICTPGVMMAALELLRVNPHPAEAEVTDALGGVLCRCTGYRKIIAAVVHATGSPRPSLQPDAGQAVGQPIRRLDGGPKVDGTESFGADSVPEGALLVRAIRSPYFHADFELGDVEAWTGARPGVTAVLTAADIAGRNCYGVIPALADQPALAEKHVRFLGEPVALVVGNAEAIGALDLDDFPVTWSPRNHVLTEAEGAATTAPQLHEGRPGNLLITGRVATGNADAALAVSVHIASGRFETSFVEHAYIEPEAGAAWLDGDHLVIRACTQAPVMDQEQTAEVLGLPMEKVRIIPSATGGGFGSKLDVTLQPLLGLAVLKTGRPCRMVFSRGESMMASTKRHPATMEAMIGADAEGRITSMKFHGDFNTGAYASWGPTVASRVPVHASGPYRTPAYVATTRAIHTHGPVSGAFRGFGVPQATICQEALYDDLAGACGLDRLVFRRLNALQDGDQTPSGQVLKAVGIGACLDALKPHWERAAAEARAFNEASQELKRGIGVASCWYGCGNTGLPNPSTVRIGITSDGRLRLHQGATDIGQGSNTVITQLVADALGVAIGDIEIVGPDTALTPDCGKTSASRQTYVTGKAAVKAAEALRRTILRHTNLSGVTRIGFDADVLIASDGASRRKIRLGDLPVNEHGYALAAEETYDPPTSPLDADGQGVPYAVYGYGAQMAEVEVDLQLGTTRVIRMTAAHDLGKVINPVLAEGQIEGGIAQGLGMALMEEYVPGRTQNLHDYLIPTIGDMPEVVSILIEKPDPEGPMGAKGLGEHVLIPTAPAILNAIRDATGARIIRVPALPHRVRAAMEQKR